MKFSLMWTLSVAQHSDVLTVYVERFARGAVLSVSSEPHRDGTLLFALDENFRTWKLFAYKQFVVAITKGKLLTLRGYRLTVSSLAVQISYLEKN